MALYTFRCPVDGDFPLDQPMAETTRTTKCPICGRHSEKVLGARLQFTYGRKNFHDGPEGTGETVRETGERWRAEYREMHGRDVDPVGTRWI